LFQQLSTLLFLDHNWHFMKKTLYANRCNYIIIAENFAQVALQHVVPIYGPTI